jgi:hypothetical protein
MRFYIFLDLNQIELKKFIFSMGNISNKKETTNHKELTNEQLTNLLNNTAFDKAQILDWHKGFLVNEKKKVLIESFFLNLKLKSFKGGMSEWQNES